MTEPRECPGHGVYVWTGPDEDDYSGDFDYCDGSCTEETP